MITRWHRRDIQADRPPINPSKKGTVPFLEGFEWGWLAAIFGEVEADWFGDAGGAVLAFDLHGHAYHGKNAAFGLLDREGVCFC